MSRLPPPRGKARANPPAEGFDPMAWVDAMDEAEEGRLREALAGFAMHAGSDPARALEFEVHAMFWREPIRIDVARRGDLVEVLVLSEAGSRLAGAGVPVAPSAAPRTGPSAEEARAVAEAWDLCMGGAAGASPLRAREPFLSERLRVRSEAPAKRRAGRSRA